MRIHHAHTHRKDDDNDSNDLDNNWDDDEFLNAKVENVIDKRFDHFEKEMKKVIKENIDKKVEDKLKKELENTY